MQPQNLLAPFNPKKSGLRSGRHYHNGKSHLIKAVAGVFVVLLMCFSLWAFKSLKNDAMQSAKQDADATAQITRVVSQSTSRINAGNLAVDQTILASRVTRVMASAGDGLASAVNQQTASFQHIEQLTQTEQGQATSKVIMDGVGPDNEQKVGASNAEEAYDDGYADAEDAGHYDDRGTTHAHVPHGNSHADFTSFGESLVSGTQRNGRHQQIERIRPLYSTSGSQAMIDKWPSDTTVGDNHVASTTSAGIQTEAGVLAAGRASGDDTTSTSNLAQAKRQLVAGTTELPMERQGRSTGTQLVLHTSGGTLYSWGLREARIARKAGDNSVPEPALTTLKVISVAASRHSAIATSEGHVWTMGHNDSRGGGGHGSPPMSDSGQLGRGGSIDPARVMGDLQHEFAVQVITGRYHSMAVTDKGELWTWGLNDWGQLGRPGTVGSISSQALAKVGAAGYGPEITGGDKGSACTWGAACHDAAPRKVLAFEGKKIVAASAGRYNNLALDDQGQLWSWGYDGCGTAGTLPARADAWKPRLVKGALEGKRVVAFDSGYVLWIAATESGEVFTCNTQDDGYSGTLATPRKPNTAGELGRDGDPLVPGHVTDLAPERVVAVAAGREHAVVATDKGNVYSWGGREAVAGRSGDLTKPARVYGELQDDFIVHVAAGEYFSLAASSKNIYGWGGNDYPCVGVGHDSKHHVKSSGGDEKRLVMQPSKVAGPLAGGAQHVHALVAGYQHSLAIVTPLAAGGGDNAAGNAGGEVAGGNADEEVAEAAAGADANQNKQQAGTTTATTTTTNNNNNNNNNAAAATTTTTSSTTEAAVSGAADDIPAGGLTVGAAAEREKAKKDQPASTAVTSTSTTTSLQGSTGGAQQGEQQQQQVAFSLEELGRQFALEKAGGGSQSATGTTGGGGGGGGSDDVVEVKDHIQYAVKQVTAPTKHVADIWAEYKGAKNHADIVATAPDIFAGLPKSLDKTYKNPCWHNGTQLRCLPYFHIIGQSKCGTTDLYKRLSKHPHLFESVNKGPHWYDEDVKTDFQYYIDLYAQAAAGIAKTPQGITGEASSNTYTSSMGVYLRGHAWDRDTRGVNMSDLLYEQGPWLRLITIFRNPVDRYYSAYYYYRRFYISDPAKMPGAEQFHKDTVEDIRVWKECVAAKGKHHCLRHYHPQQLVKGMYVEWLDDWLRVWPREQFIIFRNEDYKVAQQQHMEAVFTYLGMQQPTPEQWSTIMSMPVANVFSKRYEKMKPETRKLLEDFYAPFNKALADKLQDTRWLWKDPKPPKPGTGTASTR